MQVSWSILFTLKVGNQLQTHGSPSHRYQTGILAPPLRRPGSVADHLAVTASLDFGHTYQSAPRHPSRDLSGAAALPWTAVDREFGQYRYEFAAGGRRVVCDDLSLA